jgi:transcriptional regulator with XRE-family HTH domain
MSSMVGMATLAEVVRNARNARQWSQERLALEAELSNGWVGQIETGKIEKPDAENLRKLAIALGLSYATLALAVYDAANDDVGVRLQEIAGLPTVQARRAAFEGLPGPVKRSMAVLMRDLFAGATEQLAAAVEQLDRLGPD